MFLAERRNLFKILLSLVVKIYGVLLKKRLKSSQYQTVKKLI